MGAASGWSHPSIIATDGHVAFPTIGLIDTGGGLMDVSGFSSLRRDGTDLRLEVVPGWWGLARGPDLVTDAGLVSPETGAATPVPGLFNMPGDSGPWACRHDPVADQIGCNDAFGIRSYDFASTRTTTISDSSALMHRYLAYNSTHWFSYTSVGLAAYPRDGSGQATFLRSIPAEAGAFEVSDDSVFVCLGGDVTRVRIADESATALTPGGCRNAQGIGSIVWLDDRFVYYVGSGPRTSLRILRIERGS